MIGVAVIPAISVSFVFEVFLPASATAQLSRVNRSAITGHNLAPLFIYYISWVTHVLVSVGVGVGAARSAFLDTSAVKTSVLKRFRVLIFLVAVLVVLVADDMHLTLTVMLHERVFNVLSVEPSLSPLFRQELTFTPYTVFVPTIFSLFPIVAIASAVWATATIILCASKFLIEFQRPDDDAEPSIRIEALKDALAELRSHFMALSFILATSTLATISYLRTPLGLLDGTDHQLFKAITDAVGLVWGVALSLTLLALCVYPVRVLRDNLDALSRESHITGRGQWFRDNQALLKVHANFPMALSILLPAIVAVLANLVST